MNNKTFTWLAAAGIALVLAASNLLDGPSEQELAEAVELDLQDAQQQAQAQAEQDAWRRRSTEQIARDVCRRMHGARAELLRLQDGGGYVCRARADA